MPCLMGKNWVLKHRLWVEMNFSDQFWKMIIRCKGIVYNLNVMRQTACLVFNIMKDHAIAFALCMGIQFQGEVLQTNQLDGCRFKC